MAALDAVKNFAKVTVNTGYDESATEIVLSSGHGAKLPDPSTAGEFNLVWWNSTDYEDPSDDPNVEVVRCTARSTDTLTVTRNQEGSGASTKNTATKTYKMILALTAKMITDIGSEEHNVTPTGTINGSNKVFTLPFAPSPAASLKLFLNGMYMTPGGEDYTLSSLTITYVNAPLTGAIHRAHFKH